MVTFLDLEGQPCMGEVTGQSTWYQTVLSTFASILPDFKLKIGTKNINQKGKNKCLFQGIYYSVLYLPVYCFSLSFYLIWFSTSATSILSHIAPRGITLEDAVERRISKGVHA